MLLSFGAPVEILKKQGHLCQRESNSSNYTLSESATSLFTNQCLICAGYGPKILQLLSNQQQTRFRGMQCRKEVVHVKIKECGTCVYG